jgi:acetophenone carboxylase
MFDDTDYQTPSSRRHVAEYLEIDVESETWHCHKCGEEFGSARENYKKGCRVNERDPREVHPPIIEGEEYSFAPDPEWIRLIEFYCPGCGVMIENEYLPPGHPITDDTQFDLEKLREKHEGERAGGNT